MAYKRTVEPVSEPLTTAQAKAQCRVTHSSDDTYIDSLIKAAREYCEDWVGRSLMPQTWQRTMDFFPCSRVMRLRYPPLASVSSITYVDADGTAQTLSSGDYVVDTASYRPRIALAPGVGSWPETQCDRINAVTMTYTAGYADAAAVPMKLKQGMLLLINHHYDTRTPIVIGTIATEIEMTLRALWNSMAVVDRDED